MPGPAPVQKESRRRRNKPASGEWVVLPAKNEGPVPQLPSIDGFRWLKSTKEWWALIWASPMSTQWQEADVPGLAEMAMFRQMMFKTDRLEERIKLADQVQKRADKFGLTPKGRRDLRWVVTEEDAESAGVERPLAVVRRIPAK